MGFLRLVGVFLLIVLGFGTGICGLFGVALTVSGDQLPGGSVLLPSVIAILVSVGCFFAVRALLRRDRRENE